MREHRLILAGLFATAAFAQPATAASIQVSFNGCVAPGVEVGCTVVKSGSKVYDISAAKMRPDYKRGLGISGTGVNSGKVGICMQGPILDDVNWNYTKMKCPVPRAATKRKR